MRDLEDGKQIPKAGQYLITVDKAKGSPSTRFQLASSLAINALTLDQIDYLDAVPQVEKKFRVQDIAEEIPAS